MLGSAYEAKIALKRDDSQYHPVTGCVIGKADPYPVPGWRQLGGGSTRTAYLSPSKVVYKVGDDMSNRREAEAARRVRKWAALSKLGVEVPKTHLHNVLGRAVMAMEYVPSYKVAGGCDSFDKGICDCKPTAKRLCWTVLYDRLFRLGFNDVWEANLRYTRDGRIFIIDLGEGIL